MPLYGAIEAGGTKFVCAVGTNPDDLRNEIRFSTTTPEETIGQAVDSSAIVSTPGWRSWQSSLKRFRNSMASMFSLPP